MGRDTAGYSVGTFCITAISYTTAPGSFLSAIARSTAAAMASNREVSTPPLGAVPADAGLCLAADPDVASTVARATNASLVPKL